MLATEKRKTKRIEPTIALINVVFLMLIFFLVAGTLARPLDGDLKLVSASDLERSPPPDALVIHADGRLVFHGNATTAEDHVASQVTQSDGVDAASRPTIRIVPDRELAANALVRIVAELKASGAGKVMLVSERALR